MTHEEIQQRIQFHTEEANRILQQEPMARELYRHLQQIEAFRSKLAKASDKPREDKSE